MHDLILKFIKFSIVGFTGLFVDFTITYLLKEKVNINSYIASSIGFILAASSNYLFNRIWTFSSHNENITLEYLAFIIVACIGLSINILVIWILYGEKNQNFYLSKILAIGAATTWNFVANYYFTFNVEKMLC